MGRLLRALIVEDCQDDALIVAQELRRGGYDPQFRQVQTAEEMGEALSTGRWDAVIADYHLPRFSAPAALALVKERGLDLPFIVISGMVGEATAVAVMKAGAHDYIMKDNLTRLVPAVERELREARARERHRRGARQLARERQFSDAIVDTSGALIVVLDPEGRIVQFNKACQKATGYALDEVRGQLMWDLLVPPEELARAREVFDRPASDASHLPCELHWLTKEGHRRLISWAYAHVCDEKDKVQWVIGTGIDVTEQRRLEEQLRQTAKLEAVGRLAGGIAHDFNNLLTAILGYVDLNLPAVPEGTPLYDDLVQVRNAAKRAAALTRQLLTFSRQQPAEPEVIDLNAAVCDVSKMLRHLIEENVEIKLVLTDRSLNVKADPAQMGQVMMNLAVNARDAMPSGGTLTVETSVVDASELDTGFDLALAPYAKLRVTDTGTGMTPEVRERIFEPFFTTKPVGQGTGLGLSTVYGIVQQCSGRIECLTELGRGTTFNIYLPLTETEEAPRPDRTDFGLRFGGRETILLVEDESEVRGLAARALRDFGYTVLCAPDGVEALELLGGREANVDLLVTDVVMPRMDGRELAQKVRLAYPGTKLLFVSGYDGLSAAGSAEALAGQAVLQKPFTAHRLAKRVRDVLDAPDCVRRDRG